MHVYKCIVGALWHVIVPPSKDYVPSNTRLVGLVAMQWSHMARQV